MSKTKATSKPADHDPIFEAMADYKRARRHADALSEALESAEWKASEKIGPKPWTTKSEQRAWYRRAGMGALEREHRTARAAEEQSLMALARSKPRTPAGAAAFLAFVRKDIKVGDHRWQDTALRTIADTLRGWGGKIAA